MHLEEEFSLQMTGLKCFISIMETKSWFPTINYGLLMLHYQQHLGLLSYAVLHF
ncbi:hypothetical protein Goklo_009165 [Gossypium klotzschianum]|uniref:Uncharacterized protein n=1 Tax=Gossypium klotzschianum TaxID=34286 RepID=A0A7J8V2Z4_9ROSI|nr:hypothetical protein [Gossypium klotzschianum]